jgi:hypothetical protein
VASKDGPQAIVFQNPFLGGPFMRLLSSIRGFALIVLLAPVATTTALAQTPASSTKFDDEASKRAVVKILGAGIAHAASQGESDDFGEAILRALAARLRNELVESAMTDVFPKMSASEARAARLVICLALDGNLNLQKLNQQQSKEELIAKLKEANPQIGNAADIADFIGEVLRSRK